MLTYRLDLDSDILDIAHNFWRNRFGIPKNNKRQMVITSSYGLANSVVNYQDFN